MLKWVIAILTILVFLIIVGNDLFPEWYLNPVELRTIIKLIFPFAVAALITSLVALSKNKGYTILAGIAGLIIALLFSHSSVYPIDSEWDAKEVSVVKTIDLHQKIIIESYFNPKHNRTYFDTVIVEDRYFFRKVISKAN